ncbi:CRISPR-associated protein (TIGR02710 family) [Acetivibrio thermocellus AD2]|uniref:CRISPR-associated protein (TIGR02710 family) n=1 Tax=Acetivibrio thermocellus AD2 TaxID=1138384 RepID=A0AB36TFH4_ACETH|nr:TIGR02710 family CRISPR-associated CARF protein [Acetivibrio thermocellus]ADU73840.1 CRISPR-associated protein, TIGR02710 family [Acetivibrio thermocellus DSM 1313]ALX07773.1 CRISPR-associated protein, TIGR02710 family [Acetivibrio thermocellus AD2]ANV75515.1 CRISPR-associated protein, TIGR02710 family [Acetivibrio thermocellus DSM 2360]EIC05731.1 CRISPR-associated protein, TIGR02710 family [Acetivibrio thermocellus YS]PFH02041.1 CRISPR-associated protein (TIGR02710 family) [Acetivibrio the
MELYKDLMKKTIFWREMDRSSEKLRIASEEYYKKELMPLIIEYFIQENAKKISGSCDAMVLTLGTSYEPLVLSISVLKPEKVLILYTDKSHHLLDDVIEFTKLKPSQYVATDVDAENPLQLYRKIKDVYEKWGRPRNIYVDFTGGTKSMAAGCAMAGSAIGAKLIYIAGNFLTDLRKPEPGSEKLCYIDDPYTVFGDLEREQAISLFNKMDYVSAYRIFEELEQRVPGTKEYSALKYISKAYNAWDSLDISGAADNLSKCYEIVVTEGKIDKSFVLNSHIEKLEKQLGVIRVLEKIHCSEEAAKNKSVIFDNIGYLIANLYQNAMRREKQEKYEMASLLLYRILEIVEQKRLWNYGVDTSDADFTKLCEDEKVLLEKANKIIRSVKGFNEWKQLDKKISLLAGYILLAAVGDDIIKTKKPGKEIDSINRLRNKVEARNNSIFAHGYEFISKEKYNEFKKVVEDYMNLLCSIEGIDKEELFDSCEFIKL